MIYYMARKYISAKKMDQINVPDPFILISDDSEDDDDVVVINDHNQETVDQRLEAPDPNYKAEDTELFLPSDVLKDLDEFTRQMETDLWKSRYEKLNEENQVEMLLLLSTLTSKYHLVLLFLVLLIIGRITAINEAIQGLSSPYCEY